MPASVRAIRGATTLDEDTPDQVKTRVQELLRTILDRNDLAADDLISIIFTATGDVTSMFPASAARAMGLEKVPLIGARELDVKGALPLCIRVMVHAYTESPKVSHVYLEAATELRRDLAD